MLDKPHICWVRNTPEGFTDDELAKKYNKEFEVEYRKKIEPWLTAIFQAEHLSLLLGNGFTTGISSLCSGTPATMEPPEKTSFRYKDVIERYAKETAKKIGRGEPNIEDYIRALQTLKGGFEVLGEKDKDIVEQELNSILHNLVEEIKETESGIRRAIDTCISCRQENNDISCEGCQQEIKGMDAYRTLLSLLLSFSSRTASKDRLHIFTTNYDRTIEYACDLVGIRILDRFVGALNPVFRSSRLEVDYHYNPPGIRGEPRYLEGVIYYTKLHGSLDWRYEPDGLIHRYPYPYGHYPPFDKEDIPSVIIYPNPAKDRETLDYPYSEMFRDFSVALCRPNSVLVTYGYGFGDEHINRIIYDMLTISSIHLVIISYDDARGKIKKFLERLNRPSQISLLMGSHFGDIKTLTEHYLPKAAIDTITFRMADLLKKRDIHLDSEAEKDRGKEEDFEEGAEYDFLS